MLVKLQVSSGTKKKAESSRSLLTIPEERAMLCKGTKTLKAVLLVELMKEEGSKWMDFLVFEKEAEGGEAKTNDKRPGDLGMINCR
jgi:hypothetical protein